MQPLTPALAKAVGLADGKGVLVNSVTDGSPAAHGDIKQGDVITAFDGKPIKNTRDLAMAVAADEAGHTANVTVWRDNRSHALNVTIRTQDQTKVASASNGDGTKPVGMSLEPLNSDTREQLNLPPATNGVLVAQVTPGSDADESGVQAGDVIERVGGTTVDTPDQVASAIHAAQRQKKPAVSVLVNRNGVNAFLGLQLEA
jgi:serine protease Do